MAGDLGPWSGAALLRRFAANLVASEPLADLYAHSLWALLERRGRLLEADPRLARSLARGVERCWPRGPVGAVAPRAGAGSLWRPAAGKVLIEKLSHERGRADARARAGGLTNFLYELGLLKRYKRTGWWIAGIDNPERIAEPSFRTAIIGYLLAVMEGADPAKTAALCLFHDTQATRIGDVPSVGKGYVVTAPTPRSLPTRWPASG
jgi:hypothetical protein